MVRFDACAHLCLAAHSGIICSLHIGGLYTCVSCDGETASFNGYDRLFSPVVSTSGGVAVIAPLTVGGADAEQCGFDGLLAEVKYYIWPIRLPFNKLMSDLPGYSF